MSKGHEVVILLTFFLQARIVATFLVLFLLAIHCSRIQPHKPHTWNDCNVDTKEHLFISVTNPMNKESHNPQFTITAAHTQRME